jgi:D-glycero-alpha-D-manno-heptose-7-phosphate kinase
MRNQALELSEVFLRPSFSITELGSIMDKGWENKKQLSSNISNKKIDDCYSMAKSMGALGGKISGAGGGGFLLIIADKNRHKGIIQSMSSFGLMRYKLGLDSLGSVVYEIN